MRHSAGQVCRLDEMDGIDVEILKGWVRQLNTIRKRWCANAAMLGVCPVGQQRLITPISKAAASLSASHVHGMNFPHEQASVLGDRYCRCPLSCGVCSSPHG